MDLKSVRKQVNKSKKNFTKKYLNIKKGFVKDPRKKWGVISVVILIILGVFFYSNMGLFIAALVNGQPISRFELIRRLEAQGGQQVLDGIVTESLILQEARKRNIVISDDDIQKEVGRIDEQLQAQGSSLENALILQGQTQEQLKDSINLRLIVEKILADDVGVSDEDAQN